MSIFRVTFGFAGGNQGWTETHAMTAGTANALAALPLAQAVATARAAFLCRDFKLNGIRVSLYSDGAPTPVRQPRNVWLDKANYGNGGNTAAWAGEPNPVSLQGIGVASNQGVPAQFQGNKNTTYLGGPTDTMVTNNGKVVPEANNLLGLFNAWKQVMVQNGFGWLNSVPFAPAPILTVLQNANATVTFTVTPQGTWALSPGAVYPVRVSKLNNGRSPLNRALNCRFTAPGTFTTVEQIAFALDQTNGQLRPYQNVLGFIPYGNIVLGEATIEHKRGRPFLSEPGRARKEVRA